LLIVKVTIANSVPQVFLSIYWITSGLKDIGYVLEYVSDDVSKIYAVVEVRRAPKTSVDSNRRMQLIKAESGTKCYLSNIRGRSSAG
jgi:hypothetical protein